MLIIFNLSNFLFIPFKKFLFLSNSEKINKSVNLLSSFSNNSSIVGLTGCKNLSYSSSQKGPEASGNFSNCFIRVTSPRVTLFSIMLNLLASLCIK